MSDVYPLQPAYGLTRKITLTTSAQNIDISEWNTKAPGLTQVLFTNTASAVFFSRIDNSTVNAQVDVDLPIIAGAPITISRNQTDKNISIIGTVAGGTVWVTPIQGN